MSDAKQIRLRYAGTCGACGESVPAGTQALYEPSRKAVTCLQCIGPLVAQPDLAPVAVPIAAPIDYGTAGAAARREHERRVAKDEARLRNTWGPLGGLAVALSDERQSTKAWQTGALGEERLGARLDGLRQEGMAVFHDRRIPGSRANIDHLVVTSGGILVVDAKRYKGRPRLEVEGGFLRPRTEKLLVGRRDCTALVDGVLKQVSVVEQRVGAVPVRGALCFVEADWPLFGGEFTTRSIIATWPKRLLEHLRVSHAGAAGSIDVEQVASLIATQFKPA